MNNFEIVIIPLFVAMFCIFSNIDKGDKLESTIHRWDSYEVEKKDTGERRQIVDGETLVFERLEIHATTLAPGKAPHASHTHQDVEELIIVKE